MAIVLNDEVMRNQLRVLEAARTDDAEMGARLRSAIADELKAARDRVVSGIKLDNDPRGAANSVRRVVYQKILGGNINILDRKTAGSKSNYEPPRKLRPGQRGGNRMLRSQRTDDIMHYGPVDRGFILRMVNSGTHPRYANGRNGKWTKSGGNRTFFKLQEEGDYFRGSIAARNFFGDLAEREVETAIERLRVIIDEEFQKIFVN